MLRKKGLIKVQFFVNGIEIENTFLIIKDFARERTADNRMVQTDRQIEVSYLPF